MSPKQSRGFTLIELLLVLAIMMTLLGLVGGNVIESVQRTRAQAEVVSILELLKKCSVAAFASGQSLSVVLDGNRLSIEPSPAGQVHDVVYEHLDFEAHRITFFRNGLPDTVNLSVDVDGKPRQLDFAETFDITKE